MSDPADECCRISGGRGSTTPSEPSRTGVRSDCWNGCGLARSTIARSGLLTRCWSTQMRRRSMSYGRIRMWSKFSLIGFWRL
jgi:hypothetical protein